MFLRCSDALKTIDRNAQFLRTVAKSALVRQVNLTAFAFIVGLSGIASYPATPNHVDVQVSGTWDVSFVGTVQGKGTEQDDTIVMQLKQNGSNVKGTLRFEGLDFSFPVSGKVAGTTFTYSSNGKVDPNCEFTVVGETTVDAATGRFTGSQTQANCEGTAIGKVTATRR